MAEEAKRDECTVMLLRLHINANERDIYSFLNKVTLSLNFRVLKNYRMQKSLPIFLNLSLLGWSRKN